MVKTPVLDDIGFFGPLILIVYALIVLWCRVPYLITYVIFYLLSSFLNSVMKCMIKHQRPSKTGIMYSEYESVTGSSQYGMPSGHAQSIVYSSVFIYLVTKSVYSLIGCSFLCCLTFYQRYKYQRHSIPQVLVGALTGITVASVAYYLVSKYLTNS
jgi:membrane-associated phospholipid phosphatase